MKNINFNNIPEPIQNEEFRNNIKKVQETFARISEKYTKALSPSFIEITKNINQIVSPAFNEAFLQIKYQMENNINFLPSVLAVQEIIQKIYANAVLTYNATEFPTGLDNGDLSKEKEIEFTDTQLAHIENLNININNYCDTKKSTKNNKFFTFDRICQLITTLIAIIAFFKPDTSAILLEEQNTKIIELQESVDNVTDILETILEQISDSSPDEANN